MRAETVVLQGGKALLPVVVAADAGVEEKAAAEELARVLGVMAGTEWPVRTESARGGAGLYEGRTAPAALYVGRTKRSAAALPELRPARDLLAPTAQEIGPDGFRIRTVNGSAFIEGATPEATAFAVSWLLQRYGGVRWYAPGPLGEVIPRRGEWVLPELSVVREPAYVSREISGSGGAAWNDWCRRNGLRQRLEYSHNLVNLFIPERYDDHPEWFGVVNGVRRRPLGGSDYHWQPDLARTDVAAFAADRAAEVLAQSPGRASFSLGMNDTVRFDQGAGTQAVVEPLRYFRGMPDYSPLLMTFMNRAAEALQRKPGMENRYLGCLAYFWAENPPPFPVNPRVVPYVTTDRTQFYDPAYRVADYALMSRWQRSGVRAYGLWEYGYGHAYVIPRQANRMIAEAIHEGWWRGARGYMADTGPHPGFDAFKIWMMAQLLWEPDRPLAELADDFFHGWYGPAAPAMRRFFACSEAVWMAQQGPPWWIKFYQQADQVLLFPPEVCAELRALLDEAEAEARDEDGGRMTDDRGRRSDDSVPKANFLTSESSARYLARVALTSRAFAVTEAAVAYEAVRRALSAVETEQLDAVELGRCLVKFQRAREGLERAAAKAVEGETPALATANIGYLLRDDPVPGLLARLGRREAVAPMTALAELAAAELPVPSPWTTLAAASASGRLDRGLNLLANTSFRKLAPQGHEPRFLNPLSGEIPADWELRSIATEKGRVALGDSIEGMRPLRIEGAWDTQLLQAHWAEPGRLYVAEVRMRGVSSPGNDATLLLTFLDAAGQNVGEFRSVGLPKGESDWRRLTLAETAPATAKYVIVGVNAKRQFGGDWLETIGFTLRAIQTTEDGGRMTEDGGRKTGDGGRRTED